MSLPVSRHTDTPIIYSLEGYNSPVGFLFPWSPAIHLPKQPEGHLKMQIKSGHLKPFNLKQGPQGPAYKPTPPPFAMSSYHIHSPVLFIISKLLMLIIRL